MKEELAGIEKAIKHINRHVIHLVYDGTSKDSGERSALEAAANALQKAMDRAVAAFAATCEEHLGD
jgi:hypothetical protein